MFVGSPSVSTFMIPPRTPLASPAGTLLTELAQIISHVATNVTNIVTTKLLALEDYTTWRTQFESFLVSQTLLGMVDGSIQKKIRSGILLQTKWQKFHRSEMVVLGGSEKSIHIFYDFYYSLL
ncbi:unnamed protein product [Cuscuta europaea]|uniref:Uncharacterized protein n=1 Tax=Cuscuta europaea TaxID=41803 RepID=A0A9P0Z1W4_CUSEU|nr:unnamed protein product [Cuscuta europaea]